MVNLKVAFCKLEAAGFYNRNQADDYADRLSDYRGNCGTFCLHSKYAHKDVVENDVEGTGDDYKNHRTF